MDKLTIRDLNLRGKRVLLRVDFNVPLVDGKVADDTRIRKAIPTIKLILEQGGSVVLMSHLGRPKGKPVTEMSLQPVAVHLSALLGQSVDFVADCVGEEASSKCSALQAGTVLLLENLRFHSGETDNEPVFAGKLARLGDVFVNDAFGAAHRAHASTVGVATSFQVRAAGLLLEKEIDYLSNAIDKPVRPLVAILGGAKISGKIDVIANLLPKVDALLIGGGMAFTFLKAQGLEIGRSILEADRVPMAGNLIRAAGDQGKDLLLPLDVGVTDSLDNGSYLSHVAVTAMEPHMIGVDIGPQTISLFRDKIASAKTVVWNGPMGIFENPKFAVGTVAVAKLLGTVSDAGGITIVGGGDSVAAVNQAGLDQRVTHISTGGGASLELLSGYELPGLAALTEKREYHDAS